MSYIGDFEAAVAHEAIDWGRGRDGSLGQLLRGLQTVDDLA